MNETSGVLEPVVRKYLEGRELQPLEVGVMRAYLRQWVAAAGFRGPDVDELRRDVERIASTADVHAWLNRAIDVGIDPL
jgi:hypothetical protein